METPGLPACYPLIPPFSFRRIMLPREKGHRSRSITTSKLTRGIVLKLVRQHILLTLIPKMSDPVQFSSVQFSHSVMSDSLRPHELQHTRPPCPSPTPRVHSDSRPSNPWCHPAISSSVVSFSSCPQSLPASVFSNDSTLHMRWPKYWSFSFSISPSNAHPSLISFRMDWLDLLAVQGTLKSLLQTTVQKHHFFGTQPSSQSNSHIHTWPQEKP